MERFSCSEMGRPQLDYCEISNRHRTDLWVNEMNAHAQMKYLFGSKIYYDYEEIEKVVFNVSLLSQGANMDGIAESRRDSLLTRRKQRRNISLFEKKYDFTNEVASYYRWCVNLCSYFYDSTYNIRNMSHRNTIFFAVVLVICYLVIKQLPLKKNVFEDCTSDRRRWLR